MRSMIYALALFGLTCALTESATANGGFLGFLLKAITASLAQIESLSKTPVQEEKTGRHALSVIYPGCTISYF